MKLTRWVSSFRRGDTRALQQALTSWAVAATSCWTARRTMTRSCACCAAASAFFFSSSRRCASSLRPGDKVSVSLH